MFTIELSGLSFSTWKVGVNKIRLLNAHFSYKLHDEGVLCFWIVAFEVKEAEVTK